MEPLINVLMTYRLKAGTVIYENGIITGKLSKAYKVMGVILEIDGRKNQVIIDMCQQDVISARNVKAYLENFHSKYVSPYRVSLLENPELLMTNPKSGGSSVFLEKLNKNLKLLQLPLWCSRYFTGENEYVDIKTGKHLIAKEDDVAFIRPVLKFSLY